MFFDDFQGFSDRYCFRHFANRSGTLSSEKDLLFSTIIVVYTSIEPKPQPKAC